jgi:hypothetical protein
MPIRIRISVLMPTRIRNGIKMMPIYMRILPKRYADFKHLWILSYIIVSHLIKLASNSNRVGKSEEENFNVLKQSCKSGMVYPGSEFFPFFNPKKWFLSSRKCDPDPDFLPIPDPGVKKAPDPGSGYATLV